MTKDEINMKKVLVFLLIVLFAKGFEGLISLLDVVKSYLNVIPYCLNDALKNVNSGIGLIPTILSHKVVCYLVGSILMIIPFGKSIKSIIGKVCYNIIDNIITPALNWINNIVFK